MGDARGDRRGDARGERQIETHHTVPARVPTTPSIADAFQDIETAVSSSCIDCATLPRPPSRSVALRLSCDSSTRRRQTQSLPTAAMMAPLRHSRSVIAESSCSCSLWCGERRRAMRVSSTKWSARVRVSERALSGTARLHTRRD
jgi:hypothetical protein